VILVLFFLSSPDVLLGKSGTILVLLASLFFFACLFLDWWCRFFFPLFHPPHAETPKSLTALPISPVFPQETTCFFVRLHPLPLTLRTPKAPSLSLPHHRSGTWMQVCGHSPHLSASDSSFFLTAFYFRGVGSIGKERFPSVTTSFSFFVIPPLANVEFPQISRDEFGLGVFPACNCLSVRVFYCSLLRIDCPFFPSVFLRSWGLFPCFWEVGLRFMCDSLF